MKRLVFILFALSAAACGSDSSTAAPTSATLNMSGTWSGGISDSLAGPGTVRFSLSQSGNNVTGTYATAYPIGNGGGSFTGTVAGTSLSGSITQSVAGVCPFTVNANVSGSTMSGTFAAFNCTGVETGSFSVTKQ
jgi:hypothetical protein